MTLNTGDADEDHSILKCGVQLFIGNLDDPIYSPHVTQWLVHGTFSWLRYLPIDVIGMGRYRISFCVEEAMRIGLAYALILAATIYVAWSMGGVPHPYTTQAWEGR